MANTEQPCREKNIEAITKYITRAMIPNINRVGIKLEHIIVHAEDGTRVGFTEDGGIADIMEELMEDYPEAVYNDEDLIIKLSRNYTGVLEEIIVQPGGQIQFCAGPFINTEMAQTIFGNFEDSFEKILKNRDMRCIQQGYGWNEEAMDVELVHTPRYDAMDKYFLNFSGFGMCMMRNMAATQISIDFASEEDCIRKLRYSAALAPLLALMADNSVQFEAEPREQHMVRTFVWNAVDRSRCGVCPGLFDKDFTLAKYAEWVLDTVAICYKEKGKWVETDKTFGEIYAEKAMKPADVEHALTMVFPDARLTNYIEIRTADALPYDVAVAFSTFIKGLFANERSLGDLERLFGEVTERDITLAKMELMTKAYDATVYGRNAQRICEQLHITSKLSLNAEERKVIEPLTTMVFQQTNMAAQTMFI